MHFFYCSVYQSLLKNLPPTDFMEVKRIGRELGRGAFGRVIEIECIGDDRKFAAKIMRSEDMDVESGLKLFYAEYACLTKNMSHPNIVQYEGLCLLPSCVFPLLVMELMTSDLHSFLLAQINRGLFLTRMITLLHEIAKGLEFLHQKSIIHRDLTARNVLMSRDDTPKISDFGNSCLVDTAGDTTRTGLVGTVCYMAPEIVSDKARYNCEVDVFSFGHLALFVSLQEFPKSLLPAVTQHMEVRTEVERRVHYFQKLAPDFPLTPLMEACLHNVIDTRPSSTELKVELSKLKATV